ncbi:hypothetical protein [Paenibacillus swuensis]|uniref:hypothetical protein n=1 Tax=Paenibacillus swuensis TaxID=1178515 RepID=UPI0012FB6391|nr:hypothetical protein [Paenibacillus swuensis]
MKLVLSILFIVIFCMACSSKSLEVGIESYLRWNSKEKVLEIYAVIKNMSERDSSFEASIIIENEKLQQLIGFETETLEFDDRKGKTPFKLSSYTETVFKREYGINEKIKKDILTNSVYIRISTKDETIDKPISYIDFIE